MQIVEHHLPEESRLPAPITGQEDLLKVRAESTRTSKARQSSGSSLLLWGFLMVPHGNLPLSKKYGPHRVLLPSCRTIPMHP